MTKSRARLLACGVLILLLTGQAGAQARRRRAARNVAAPAPRVRFVAGESSLHIPFELAGNLVLMRARVNESEPLWFILDTGADSTVLDARTAKALRLRARGRMVGTGSAGMAEAVILKGVSLKFPNVEATDQTVAALPLDFLSAPLGRKIGGVIGNDIIKELVVEIDYAARLISLYKPESYRYAGAGEVVPLTVEDNLPFARATVTPEGRAPIEGKFELDTGSTGAVLLNTPFVKKHRLLNALGRTSRARIGGVGGTAQAILGRLKSFALGRFLLENPVARFSQAARGDYASARYDGLVGGEIFRRFRAVFDYSRRRLILEPNAQFSESYEVDMSGLQLVGDGDDFSTVLVDDVEAGSPGAEAGVRGGDIITAIDGRPAAEFTLEGIRKLFTQDGREYSLTLKRGAQEVRARLRLRRSV